MLTACVECGRPIPKPASRCAQHPGKQKTPRTNAERQRRAQAVASHRAQWGDLCFGYNRAPHQASDLTADHVNPRAMFGDDGPLQVLCRSCNSSRGAKVTAAA